MHIGLLYMFHLKIEVHSWIFIYLLIVNLRNIFLSSLVELSTAQLDSHWPSLRGTRDSRHNNWL